MPTPRSSTVSRSELASWIRPTRMGAGRAALASAALRIRFTSRSYRALRSPFKYNVSSVESNSSGSFFSFKTRLSRVQHERTTRTASNRSERFDAVRVVRSCCTLESRVLKEKKLPLEFDSTLETLYLKGDPNALYDLLVNLIRNAADASAARPAPIRVGLIQEASSLRLTVEDRGVGIRPQDLERIFEPGYTTKEFGEGSGMGLVVVQSVIRNMFAGSIAVDSKVGVGTTVTVTLPIPAQRSLDRQP